MAKGKDRETDEHVARFAARLRELRLARGLTQTELGTLLGVTQPAVGRLEQAAAAPGVDTLGRFADALGVPAADLLPGPRPDPLPVFRAQAEALTREILELGDEEAFLALNPLLVLILNSLRRRRGG